MLDGDAPMVTQSARDAKSGEAGRRQPGMDGVSGGRGAVQLQSWKCL